MQQTCKPGSVRLVRVVFVIYLDFVSLRNSSDLPPDIGRAALHAPVYMILQPIRRTARDITAATVGSYPAFSPLPRFPVAVILCYATQPSRIASR